MSAKHKPAEIVIRAAHFLEHPEEATLTDIKSMAARLLGESMSDEAAEKTKVIKPRRKQAAASAPPAPVKKSRAA